MIEKGDLQNRQERGGKPRGSDAVDAEISRGKTPSDAAELARVKSKIDRARTVLPSHVAGDVVHCGHCFGLGRDTALRVIDETTPET